MLDFGRQTSPMHIRYLKWPLAGLFILSALVWSPVVEGKSSRHSKPYIVVLDPGHGGDDTGAVSPDGSLTEKNMNLDVAKLAAADLQHMGYTVYLTRTRDQR